MRTLATLLLGSASYSSTLLGTSWRLKLNVGLEPGSWMPKIVDGWGASGARVVVDALVDFDATPAAEGEELVGPMSQTKVLKVRGGGKIVTFEGEQEVTFESGGWCVQRPLLATPRNDEGLLRFWLDCPSGCVKNDISIAPGERLFFSTGVWDDSLGLRSLRDRASIDEERLNDLEAESSGNATSEPLDLLSRIPIFGPFRQRIKRAEKLNSLRQSQRYYKSWPGLEDPGRAALIASRGSLSLKRQRPRGYIYLGVFDAEPVPVARSDS